ncbi:hypothetical protein [Frankia sp. CiP1_Cm_nod2]|uniref:hypothetical protein n=1 Tax=Frankia sp. CiP1_Cm_nod2 TaxID=2897161 RepID=UPI00202472A4
MSIEYTRLNKKIDYTHLTRGKKTSEPARAAVPIVDLDAALAAGCGTSRIWSRANGPASQAVGSTLAIVEQPRFISDDPDDGMTAVIAERGYSGRSVLVGTDGRSLTPRNFIDYDVAYAANGSVALARRHTAEALGIPAGGDYIQAHIPHVAFENSSPWSRVALLSREQPYTGLAGASPRPERAMFETFSVAITADGSRAVFLEFRPAGSPDCALWEYDLTHRTWRWVTGNPAGSHWQAAPLAYSPDGTWLLVGSNPPALVRLPDGMIFPLGKDVFGVHIVDAGWWPTRPGHLVATGPGQKSEADVFDVDLERGRAKELCRIRGQQSKVSLLVASPRVSADGRWLAFLAPVGMDPTADAGRGSGKRPFVADLASSECELVLPVRFSCGVERSCARVIWVDQTVSDGTFQPAAALQAGSRPAFGNPVLAGSQVEMFRKQHACAAQLMFDAISKSGTEPMLVTEEIRRFCAGALEADPSFADTLEGPESWTFVMYVGTGSPRDDRDGWLALSSDLGRLRAGEPMESDISGRLHATVPEPQTPSDTNSSRRRPRLWNRDR